ncbi:siderophore-interacting protein [Phytohabitans sp. ZYX-F-186]|uniref:Siderophore-interacting protein n=1 Tax=Phytohabitans maris TaxID=3071409 RepID=A0ABU0ZGR6_9ACTN|nr:siderophore-interacting protein [Phytohabitans sp. ZYX-F-186]MDQ7905537.1 siderophore-interacting protein [Phytohabitans sp. ZYX-F-186]
MKRLLDNLLRSATVHKVESLGARFKAITLTGPEIAGLSIRPGQQVRVQVGAANFLVDRVVGALRTYSVWRYDDTCLELRVFDHGEGPGAQWARTVSEGDRVHILGPEGRFFCRPSPYHLFVGDETASVAFGAMIRALDDDAPVYAVIEVDTEHEQLPIPGNVVWVHRRGRSPVRSAELGAAVARLDLPSPPGTAYLAGEAGTIQLVRNHLVSDRGWGRRDVMTKPFWAPGRRGMD